MKKAYSKPEIMFDDFSLSANIASVCEEKVGSPTEYTCGLKYGMSTIFTQDSTGCKTKVDDGSGKYNGLCYHIPSEDYNVFNS